MVLLFRLALAIAINALALWVANILWDSVSLHGFWAYFIGALVLGIANAVIKPILALLTLPLIILTLKDADNIAAAIDARGIRRHGS